MAVQLLLRRGAAFKTSVGSLSASLKSTWCCYTVVQIRPQLGRITGLFYIYI